MRNKKNMSNNNPIPNSSKSDSTGSSPSDDFGLHGFAENLVYLFGLSLVVSVSLVVMPYTIEHQSETLQNQSILTVARNTGFAMLSIQVLIIVLWVGIGYLKERKFKWKN